MKSSNIISTGYKRASRTLYIKFDGDVVYRYEGVPDGVFEDFLSAESHGRYAYRHISRAYKYERC